MMIEVEYFEQDRVLEITYFDHRVQISVFTQIEDLKKFYYDNDYHIVEYLTIHLTGAYEDRECVVDFEDFYYEGQEEYFIKFLIDYFNQNCKDQFAERLKTAVLEMSSEFFLINDDVEAMEVLCNGQFMPSGYYFVDDWGTLLQQKVYNGFEKFIDLNKAVYVSELNIKI